MYHYTYLIQSNTTAMRYIGVRSSKCLPIDDTKYWGSSRHLPADVKLNHTKIILKIHSTRVEAVEHEILLHEANNVAVSLEFYNKAKQTSVGFDTSGIKLTAAHVYKATKHLKGRKLSEKVKAVYRKAQSARYKVPGYCSPLKGTVMSNAAKLNHSKAMLKLEHTSGCKNIHFVPWFITIDNITHLFYHTTKTEYERINNVKSGTIKYLLESSRGVKPIKKGKYKGYVVGNIPIHVNK